MGNDKKTENTNDFDALMQRLTEKNLSDDKVKEVIAAAGNLPPEQAKQVIDRANAKMGNKEIKKDPEHSSDSKAGSGVKDPKGRMAEEAVPDEALMDGASSEQKGKRRFRLLDNIKKTVDYIHAHKQIKDVYRDDPLKAFEELAKQKPDGQAPAYIQRKYDADRSDLLRNVDERIRISPEGTRYSPEKLGEELYKYQNNAETEAFAKDVLKNNQNNTELQESYKEAANKDPQQEGQGKKEKGNEEKLQTAFQKRALLDRSSGKV